MLKPFSHLFLAALLTAAASSAIASTNPNSVVATIDGQRITLSEFNRRYDQVKADTLNPPTRRVFLEDVVRYKLGLMEAKKEHLERDPLVQEMIDEDLYKALLERKLSKQISQIKVTVPEMQAYYRNHPEIRFSHILIEYRPGATPKEIAMARKRAMEIWNKVKHSKRSFANLVKLYSDDVFSKRVNGDAGWQNSLTIVPNLYHTLLRMKIGQVKGIIQTAYGFHIVKLTGRHTFAQANQQQIRAAVFDQKRKKVFDRYFAKLKRHYTIHVYPSVVEK